MSCLLAGLGVMLLEPGAGLGQAFLNGGEAVVRQEAAELGVAGRLLVLPVRLGRVELYRGEKG